MKISKDTKEILAFMDYSANGNIRKRDDLSLILELSATYNEVDIFNDIIFSATSLWKIYKAIKNAEQETEVMEKLKKESIIQADYLKSKLKLLIGDENISINARFEEVYYPNSSGAFYNLIDLAHDLAELKKIQMNQKK